MVPTLEFDEVSENGGLQQLTVEFGDTVDLEISGYILLLVVLTLKEPTMARYLNGQHEKTDESTALTPSVRI